MSARFQLWLGHPLTEKIREHGEATYPHECCGALLGHDAELAKADGASEETRRVVSLLPLSNRNGDSPRNRFSLTAEDVRAAEAAAREQNLEVIGWYHSHPDHPAKPSEFDRLHAWPWYSYLIVSVQRGFACEMTSWRLNDDREGYTPEQIELDELHAKNVREAGAVSNGFLG
jgi:proteasome lid subunit RPN8/RPN11